MNQRERNTLDPEEYNMGKGYDMSEIKEMPADEAIPILDKIIELHSQEDEAYTLRGQKYWSQGKRREAINDYLQALAINPEGRAKMLLEYANSILSYYNKDLLNP